MATVDPHRKTFRFGAQIDPPARRSDWLETCRRLEDSGIDVLLVSDHFGAFAGPFAVLGAAAAVTNRIRLGTLVLGNDFRHPAVVAKEAATLDVLSEGRVEIGLGAGWTHRDYTQTGLPFDDARVRVSRLEESARVIRGLHGPTPFSFRGTHYAIDALDGFPKPLQETLPILIGGGRRGVLSAAARVADIVGVHVAMDGRDQPERQRDARNLTRGATEERLEWVRSAAGQRFGRLELQVNVYLIAIDRPAAETAAIAEQLLGIPSTETRDSVHVLAGSVDGIVETLLERRERYGISYITSDQASIERLRPAIERLEALGALTG